MINSTVFLHGTTVLQHGSVGYADELVLIGIALTFGMLVYFAYSFFGNRTQAHREQTSSDQH